jgi:glycogen operon protein
MLLAGDEMGRSQQGNNNAYCQDNELNWIDWAALEGKGGDLAEFTGRLLALRGEFPVLQADTYRHLPDDPLDDSIQWLNSDGKLMRDEHWHEHRNHVVGYLLTESIASEVPLQRQLLVIFNAAPEAQGFTVPPCRSDDWHLIVDTARESAVMHEAVGAGSLLRLPPRSMKILIAGGGLQLSSAAPTTNGG